MAAVRKHSLIMWTMPLVNVLRISAPLLPMARAQRADLRYDCDSMGRLERVSYDLTPDDHSISDGRVFRSTYSYDGSSFAYTYRQYQGPAGSFI